jgi:hypothetical protein
MSAIRFALMSFLFLFTSKLLAQQDFVDLFEDQRAYKMAGGNTGLYYPVKGPFSLSDYAETRVYPRASDTLSINLKRIEVSSFRYYVDESFFDSAMAY